MHWFSEEGVSLTRFPRCYNICQPDDMEAFVDDFRLTACLNTLKWVVEVVDRDGANAVQSPQGKVQTPHFKTIISSLPAQISIKGGQNFERGLGKF
jgi:hypothetical protein